MSNASGDHTMFRAAALCGAIFQTLVMCMSVSYATDGYHRSTAQSAADAVSSRPMTQAGKPGLGSQLRSPASAP